MRIMTFFCIFCLVLCCLPVSAQTGEMAVDNELLTNDSVLKMVRAKLGDTLIISKIKNSKNDFDISTSAIITLKENGVSEKVIEAMIGGDEYGASVISTQSSALAVSGRVFYQNGKKLEPLEYSTATVSAANGKNFARSFFSRGFAPTDNWSFINGKSSSTRLKNDNAIFYARGDSSAKEVQGLALVRLDYFAKKDMRYIITQRAMNGTKIPAKQQIDVDFENQKNGLFKITPKSALSPGEYAIAIGNQFYDFGIDTENIE